MEANSKIKIAFGLSLILIVLIKLTLPDPPNNKEQIREFWVTKTHSTSKFNVVVCGDSRVYRGVSLEALNQNAIDGRTGINLGYSGSGYSDQYLDFALSKLDRNASSNVLVLGVTPHSLTREAFKNEDLKSYQKLSWVEVFSASYLSPILKHFAPFKAKHIFGRSTINHVQNYMSGGWVASYFRVLNPESALPSYRKTFGKYQVKETEVLSFLEKVKEITSSGITVIAFRPPSTEKMRMLEDSISGFDELYIKQELIDRSAIWMDFPETEFASYDGSHLHFESAEKLSEMIGNRINELDR